MTIGPDQLAALEAELGSEISAYQPWLGIDVETGDWWDTNAKFEAADLEAMLTLDGRARGVQQVLTLPLRGAPLTIKPAEGDRGEAELVNHLLDTMTVTPLEQVKGQIAQSLIYRITYQEKCFTVTDDAKIGYSAIAWRPPDSCGVLRDKGTGRVNGFTQDLYGVNPGPVRILGPKAGVFIHGADQNPVRGVTEMAVSYRCFRDKQKLRALWMLLLERLGAPWIVARTQSGQEAAVAGTLSRLRGGGVAAVSGLDDAPTVLDVTGEVGQIFQAAVMFLDAEMAGSVLAGFLDLASAASRGAGSLALSVDQTDFYSESMDAAAREIATSFRAQIVTPLVRYNFGPAAAVPTVTLGPIGGATNSQLISMLQALAAAPSGSILPSEFIDEITLRVAGALDLDVDKIAAAIREAESRPAPPAAAPTQRLHAAVTTLHDAVAAPEEFRASRAVGLAGEADPKAAVDLASRDGHHIPGTPYTYRHGWEAINPQEGFTIHPFSGRQPRSGYQVAQLDHTHTYPEIILDDEDGLTDAVEDFLEHEQEVFSARGAVYIGGWVHDGKLWLEPSERVGSRRDAQALGTERNQVSVWDNRRGREIPTGGTGGGRITEHDADGNIVRVHDAGSP